MNILIGGLGDLGRRCGLLWTEAGHRVVGMRRRSGDAGLPFAVETADMAALRPAQFANVDLALFCASPDARDERAYHHCYETAAHAFMAAVPTDAVRLLVSSTAVLEGGDGQWVDEEQFQPSTRWNGQLLHRAEQSLWTKWPQLCVLRPSGLYGPGREWLLRKAQTAEPGGGRYTHRIHIDDCARAIVHLATLPSRARTYLLTDDAPLPEWQVLAGVAQLLGRPAALRGPPAEGRRLSNARLHASGFALRYPNFRSGYRAIISQRSERIDARECR